MVTYLTPPGASLSGGGNIPLGSLAPIDSPRSGNAPIDSPRGANAPIDAPRSGNAPIDGPRAANAPIDPHHVSPRPTPAPFPLPLEGVDPSWVYSNSSALLAQALRKSRAKIMRPGDDRLTSPTNYAAARRGQAIHGSHLWRWDPEFRVSAVACQLLGRFQVHGHALWMIDPGDNLQRPRPVATKVFEIRTPRGPAVFADQIDKVQRAAVEREDRLPEILSQANSFWPFFESVVGIRLSASPRMAELLEVVHIWGSHLVMALKHNIAARRPVQCSSWVIPVISTPGHGSLPSGHATMSALMSELLSTLLHASGDALAQERAVKLDRLARRIAFNRVVAGLHFPLDSLVGYALGTQMARLLIALAGPGRTPAPVNDKTFEALDAHLELKELSGQRPAFSRGVYTATPAPALVDMWSEVLAELKELRV